MSANATRAGRSGRRATVLAVAGLMLALFLVALDQTIVGTALPESNALATVVESLGLSRPEVGFYLRSDGRRTLALPAAADLRERYAAL